MLRRARGSAMLAARPEVSPPAGGSLTGGSLARSSRPASLPASASLVEASVAATAGAPVPSAEGSWAAETSVLGRSRLPLADCARRHPWPRFSFGVCRCRGRQFLGTFAGCLGRFHPFIHVVHIVHGCGSKGRIALTARRLHPKLLNQLWGKGDQAKAVAGPRCPQAPTQGFEPALEKTAPKQRP